MAIIYIQSTIDFILSTHSHRISEIETLGTPVKKQLDNKTIYYKIDPIEEIT